MLAADVATLKQGARTDLASIEAKSQAEAADLLNVSRNGRLGFAPLPHLDRSAPSKSISMNSDRPSNPNYSDTRTQLAVWGVSNSLLFDEYAS